MPKMKTKSGAKKRFKATANGFKHKHAFKSHTLNKPLPIRSRLSDKQGGATRRASGPEKIG